MDHKLLREREAKCIQECPPACTAGCPVRVDARGLVAAVKAGDYARGFSLLQAAVPFPRIISRICDQPCQAVCKRQEIDTAISINALERVCADRHEFGIPSIVPLPPKPQKAAVVGAGLSGLTAALELSRKGYKVAVFEAGDRLGGRIRDLSEDKMPRQWVERDFAVFTQMPVEIQYSTSVGAHGDPAITLAGLCDRFDAVYLGIGKPGMDWPAVGLDTDTAGNLAVDPVTLATSHPQIFAGGSLRQAGQSPSPIGSIADGKIAAVSIDRLLQGASLTASRDKEGSFAASLYVNIAGVKPARRVAPSDPAAGYTGEEAAQEAGRCLACECRECVKACEYLAHYGSYPKRYVREVFNNLALVKGIHTANRLINSCSLCGLCGELCPNRLDMGEVCREARQMMVQKGKMPPSVHDFALRDMEFSSGDSFVLNRHQPGRTASSMAFFPGCQLAASSPQSVRKLYEFLCAKAEGGVGLMLGCCGAPADWAGQEEKAKEILQAIEGNWRNLGSPRVITACPACFSIFKRYLPAVPAETVWTLLDRTGLPEGAGAAVRPQTLAVHDSCTTRHETELQDSVRRIAAKLGHQIEELPRSRERTICCGYGGLMLFANREVAGKEIQRRIGECETDYLAYCAMCRDYFAGQGKRVYHLLDLLFGSGDARLAEQAGPGYSQRQENRARLKIALLREMWGETVAERLPAVKVSIPDPVKSILEDRRILVSDVESVIAQAEKNGSRLKSAASGHYLAYFRPAAVTYWVEYSPQGDGFVLHNAYSHRLEIMDTDDEGE
ncbi:pyridine nucleotide-disulfide oxidoreductase/dicluster-binding protein [Acetonema longum]|uniref:Amine oxidase n=1 Tax=Acetonema longum DSM 6540 TaxID=1009370 RepID=F7NEC3_9FIRM|nr:pyridine nucleotide-disulfide oxidoreductase/dicluster-binding protein [Acetonema longum]EGO65635.1 hypothetical protein ALO_01929 [Acetonema longum DSM 6540]